MKSGAVQFSGGKDSTALLYFLGDRIKDLQVYFLNTGAMFPHVIDHVHKTCEVLKIDLKEISPPLGIEAYIAVNGLPSDIVPNDALPEYNWLMSEAPKQLVQPYMRCCTNMISFPMDAAIRKDGHTLIIRGSKKSDRRVGVTSGHIAEGVTYESPLWNWTDGDVYGFLERWGVTLPKQYPAVNDSLDCWLCTGHTAYEGANKLAFMKEAYPELHRQLLERMKVLADTVKFHIDRAAIP